MKVARYEFAEGARFQSGAVKSAAAVGAHLDLLRKQCKGELTPADVVQDAKHNNSPLHSYFEWSDGAAAEQYRLQQARGLIRAVVAVYQNDGQSKQVTTRAYVHVPERGASHYRSMPDAMAVKSTREAVLRQAWTELQQWRRRYKDLQEFAELFAAADDIANALRLPKPA
jgi:hypothetical protein